MKLSLLNFFSSPAICLNVAKAADQCESYIRVWFGEHHTDTQVTDPFTLAITAAGQTSRIRLGSGGLGLLFRNPYLVAEAALTAGVLLPDRIDLGVTRAGIGDQDRLQLLCGDQSSRSANVEYAGRVAVLGRLLAKRRGAPPLFVIGMSNERALQAGELGAGFVTSYHHGGTQASISGLLATYREHFSPGALPHPYTIVVVSGCISTHASTVASMKTRDAASLEVTPPALRRSTSIFGTPLECAPRLRSAGIAVGADEVMFLSIDPDGFDACSELAECWNPCC